MENRNYLKEMQDSERRIQAAAQQLVEVAVELQLTCYEFDCAVAHVKRISQLSKFEKERL